METYVLILVVIIFAFFVLLEFLDRKKEAKISAEHLLTFQQLQQRPLSELFEMVQSGSIGMLFRGLGWGSCFLLTTENPVSKIGNTHVKIKNKRVPIGAVSYGVPAQFRFEFKSKNSYVSDFFYKENDKKIPVVWHHYPNKDTDVYVLLNCTAEDLDNIFKATSSSTILKG